MNGQVEHRPVGQLCLHDGTVMEAFPNKSVDDMVAFRKTVNGRKEYDKASEKAAALQLSQRAFKPSSVSAHNSLGVRMEVRYSLVSFQDFAAHFSVPHTAIESLKLKVLNGVLNEEAEMVSGVLLRPEGLPTSLRYRTIVLYSDMSNVIIESAMDSASQLRHSQAKETYSFCNRATLGSREGPLRTAGPSLPAMLTYNEVAKAAKQIQASRELQEAGASAADEVLEGEGQPRRGLQAPSIGVMATAPKKQARSGAGGRGAGAQRRAAPTGIAAPSRSSARSMAGDFATPPAKRQRAGGSSGLLRHALDSTCSPGQAGRSDAGSGSGLATMYPKLNIDAILRGSLLGRTLYGVWPLAARSVRRKCSPTSSRAHTVMQACKRHEQ